MLGQNPRASFTLIELLIVIAIVAILSVVILLTLNPTELLKQARDSNRIADMDTLNKALTLYIGDRGGSLGTASTTYLSLIDPAATTTAGTNCASLGLTAPFNWNYHCAASSTARKLDGTGWIPLNFSSITFSPPFGALPLDPTNTSSSGLYYMYVPGTTTYAISAALNSSKYLTTRGNGDGGLDPGRLEAGSNLSLISGGEGLVGLWTFDEGSGSTSSDASAYGNHGTWSGSGTRYGAGKVGPYAGLFASSTGDVVNVNASIIKDSAGTLVAWANPSSTNTNSFIVQTSGGSSNRFYIQWVSNLTVTRGNPAVTITLATAPALNTWYHTALTWENGTLKGYLNGSLIGSNTYTSDGSDMTSLQIGKQGSWDTFQGKIDDVRVYSRALSAAEIAALYNAQR